MSSLEARGRYRRSSALEAEQSASSGHLMGRIFLELICSRRRLQLMGLWFVINTVNKPLRPYSPTLGSGRTGSLVSVAALIFAHAHHFQKLTRSAFVNRGLALLWSWVRQFRDSKAGTGND